MRKAKKSRVKYVIRRVLSLLVVGLIIYGCFFFKVDFTSDNNENISNKETEKEKVKEKEEEKPKSTSLSLVMVGDALIHSALYDNMYVDGVYDFKPMLEVMKPIISKYDLAYYNQETILGGTELGLSTYPRFNSPYEVGDAFLDTGFNIVSMANNHTLDRGERAVNNSCMYWKEKNVYTAGSYCSLEDRNNVKIYEKNGIKYAMLSYTTVTNGINPPKGKEYLTNIYSDAKAKEDIEKYRDKVDLLMVAMHWGEEYTHKPINSQVRIANYLSSLGVDIIIGAHPHVVEPIEKIGNTLVIYSLGNFVSAQSGIHKLTGLMVSVNVTKDLETNETTVGDVEAELLYTLKDYSKKHGFRVYPYTTLTDDILPEHNKYYNQYMNIVTGDKDWIKRGDYSGDSK